MPPWGFGECVVITVNTDEKLDCILTNCCCSFLQPPPPNLTPTNERLEFVIENSTPSPHVCRVNKMRMEKKHFDDDGKRSTALTLEKIDALEDIGFTWARQKGDKLWEDKYRDLQAYQARHGNCNVPTKYRVDTALGRWVSTQRKQYKEMLKGQRTLMTKERARRLEDLGFRWNAMDRHEDAESP